MKLKKQTPDFVKAKFDKDGNLVSKQIGIQKKDKVGLVGKVMSLVGGMELKGIHYFDSYAPLDCTVFICPTHTMSMTYCVKLSDVIKLDTWRDTIPN